MNRFLAAGLVFSLGLTTPLHAQIASWSPVTDAMLKDPAAANWLQWRRDHHAAGYSPLDQITPENAGRLTLAWTWTMEAGDQEQEPLVYEGVMFLPHTSGKIQALDAATGELIWEYQRRLPREMRGTTTRNLALYEDKLFFTTEDAFLAALDAKTGKLIWEIKTGSPDDRVNYSSGPIVADGKVFAGQTCGTGTPRACFLSAHDATTGRMLWSRSSVAGPNDPPEAYNSWGGVPMEGRKKASFWLTGSYDPDLKLVYWTTASPYPYPGILKGTGDGSLLYTNSILALEADTGKIRWHYQMQPRDNFDMDHQDNPILADVEIGGQLRKVVFVLGKPGILWAFDRVTGEHLWNRQLVAYQNLYESIDPETGVMKMNESIMPRQVGDTATVCPGMRGGKLFQTNAYNPVTRTVYSPVSNACNVFKVVSLDVNDGGVDYSSIEHMPESNGNVGRIIAVSGIDGKVLWTHDQRAAVGSVLTTAGKLVFYGDLHRYFTALDAETGKQVWQIPLSAPVTGYPISYAVNGKQYVAVGVGGGTPGTRQLSRLYQELNVQHGSNTLMVFALPE